MLIIQSPFQANMLKLFSSQRTVFVDDTHGTNAYGIHLTTLLVVDEYGEGFPAAWCISTHIDTNNMSKFFEVLNGLCPMMLTNFTMHRQKGSLNCILCIWHVLQAWKNNLKAIKDHDKEEEMYHELKVMMTKTNSKL